MTQPKPDSDVGLATTMFERNAHRRARLVLSLIFALAFGPVAGWGMAAGWFAAYLAAQALESRAFSERRLRVYGLRQGHVLTALVLNSLIYGSIVVPAVATSGGWGLACGLLFLGIAVLHAVITNQKSLPAFLAMVSPFLIYFVAIVAISANRGDNPAALLTLVVLFTALVSAAHFLWRTAADDLAKQSRAWAESEHRRFKAEASATARTAFVATVSHELRTPISAILAGAEAIERDPAAVAGIRSNAALIAEAGEMMRTLLNDLLDLSKMEAGRMSVETIEFDLQAMIGRTVAFWRAEAERKGLELSCEDIAALPRWMAGDPTRLRQILNNLFSNAIKFTDKGAIRLTIVPERRGPYWLMSFAVADSGAGMSSKQLERLFNPFEQTQVSTARTHGGTGLGLAISRELARLMGGDLTVVSQERKGSTFTLEVGLVEVEQSPADQAPEQIGDTRVLVVDDHEVNRRAVSLMLEPFGVALTTAASAADALELLAATPFDVVLMDVYMPGMDGREACRKLRSTPGPNQATPVIACTASSEPQDLDDCAAAGMSAHVAKPIDAAALHAAIARVLAEPKGIQENETPQPSAGALS